MWGFYLGHHNLARLFFCNLYVIQVKPLIYRLIYDLTPHIPRGKVVESKGSFFKQGAQPFEELGGISEIWSVTEKTSFFMKVESINELTTKQFTSTTTLQADISQNNHLWKPHTKFFEQWKQTFSFVG